MKTILVIGGTGAQGAPVVRALAADRNYHVLLFTRDSSSSHAKDLLKLENVEAVLNNSSSGFDLKSFEQAARRSYGVFINIDGFAIGEQAEVYWGMQLYETAIKAGVRHVVWSGLDNNYRASNYNPELYVGHYQGKAKVQDFIKAQPRSNTGWTIIRSGPYVEMLSEALIPQENDGTYIFNYPLATGAIPFLHLEDFGRYVHWAFENPVRSIGLDFGVSMAHVSGPEIAEAFTAVTGQDARYQDIPASAWCDAAFSRFPDGKHTKVGYRSTEEQSKLSLTYEENFTKFWNLYKASAGNSGLIQRDYNFLDEILPNRVRSIKDWMEKTNYTGKREAVLKSF